MKRRTEMKFFTCPGSRIHLHYEPRFNGTRLELYEAGRTDIQAEIEAHGKYTDLHYMLHRLSLGDRSVISPRPPVFGDFSGLPSNPVEVINLVHNAEARFGTLSAEDRARYNNDFRSWLADVLSGSVSRKAAVSGGSVSTEVVKENVSNES